MNKIKLSWNWCVCFMWPRSHQCERAPLGKNFQSQLNNRYETFTSIKEVSKLESKTIPKFGFERYLIIRWQRWWIENDLRYLKLSCEERLLFGIDTGMLIVKATWQYVSWKRSLCYMEIPKLVVVCTCTDFLLNSGVMKHGLLLRYWNVK